MSWLNTKYKIHEINVDGTNYQIGYKVVRPDLKSTGLGNTPIIQFHKGEWNYFEEHGVWAARTPSFATYVRSWLKQRYDVDTKTFIVALSVIKDVSKNGVKAKGIMFLKELEDNKMYDMEKVIGKTDTKKRVKCF
jgi:hypothetical protein